jgi:hypothetical protein
MTDCNQAITPYRTDAFIDSLATRETPSPSIIEKYQSLFGSLNWLSVSTLPDLNAVISLLLSYLHRTTSQHVDAARYMLRYLKGTLGMGIGFAKQPNSQLNSFVYHTPPAQGRCTCYAGSYWGPQDANVPSATKPSVPIPIESTRSLWGHCCFPMGSHVPWAANKEKRSSRTSCEAAIVTPNNGTKQVQHIHLLMEEQPWLY